MNHEVDQDVPLATSMANQIKEVDYTIFMSTPCQGKMAISLPIRVMGYTLLQDVVKHREELTTDSYDNMYFGFSRLHPALEIGTIMWHSSNSYY